MPPWAKVHPVATHDEHRGLSGLGTSDREMLVILQ